MKYLIYAALFAFSTVAINFYSPFYMALFVAASALVALGTYLSMNWGLSAKIEPLFFFSIKNNPLNDFAANAKNILEQFYLIAYGALPNSFSYKKGHIERTCHGAMHASRVAAHVEHLHSFNHKYDNKIEPQLGFLSKYLKTDQTTLLTLTKYAALFHDSARQAEGTDYWDHDSAENARIYLRNKKVPEYLVQLICAAAEYKDNANKFLNEIKKINQLFAISIPEKAADYLRGLIHDADCIDVIRCRKEFDVGYLNIMQKFKNHAKAKAEIIKTCQNVGAVIYKQKDACYQTDIVFEGKFLAKATPKKSFDLNAKVAYEHATNPYAATVQDLVNQGFEINVKPIKLQRKLTPQFQHHQKIHKKSSNQKKNILQKKNKVRILSLPTTPA